MILTYAILGVCKKLTIINQCHKQKVSFGSLSSTSKITHIKPSTYPTGRPMLILGFEPFSSLFFSSSNINRIKNVVLKKSLIKKIHLKIFIKYPLKQRIIDINVAHSYCIYFSIHGIIRVNFDQKMMHIMHQFLLTCFISYLKYNLLTFNSAEKS